MDLELGGKTALVTGSHRGTGYVIAQRLLAEGADVRVHGLTEAQSVQAVESLGAGLPVWGDITTEAGCGELFTLCAAPPQILINNYGTADPGTWLESTSDDWLDAYQKNVLSASRLISHWLPAMREAGWGRIINLGTVGSTRPNARMPHYYAAKGALATMTISLAKAVAGSEVRVNLVSPGLILTPEVREAYLERGRRKGWGDTWEEIEAVVAADIPIGRIVRREEVANLVLFLCSPLADGIHGQNIRVDGGSLDIVS